MLHIASRNVYLVQRNKPRVTISFRRFLFAAPQPRPMHFPMAGGAQQTQNVSTPPAITFPHLLIELLRSVDGQVLRARHETPPCSIFVVAFVDQRHATAHIRRALACKLWRKCIRHVKCTVSNTTTSTREEETCSWIIAGRPSDDSIVSCDARDFRQFSHENITFDIVRGFCTLRINRQEGTVTGKTKTRWRFYYTQISGMHFPVMMPCE